MIELLVDQQGAVQRQRAAALGIGLGGQQHLAHIGVHEDRVGWLVRVLQAGQRAHLDAVLGVSQCILVGDLGQAQRLHADADARGVHHHEHRSEALVGLSNQPAFAPSSAIWQVALP